MAVTFDPPAGVLVVLDHDINDFYAYATVPRRDAATARLRVSNRTAGYHADFSPIPAITQSASREQGPVSLCARLAKVAVGDHLDYVSIEPHGERTLGSFETRRATEESEAAFPGSLPVKLRQGQANTSVRIPNVCLPDWRGWAWVKSRPTWIEPQYRKLSDLPSGRPLHALLLHRLERPAETLFILPVSTAKVFVTLSLAAEGEAPGLYVKARRGDDSDEEVEAWVHVAHDRNGDVDCAISTVVEAAMRIKEPEAQDPLSPFNLLGFCTWSALGEFVLPTTENLRSLATALHDQEMPIGTFVLDDGWQDIRSGENGGPQTKGLWGFGAYDGLQGSLADTVSLLKGILPTLRHVGVWVSIQGHWDSIVPSSPLVAKYNMRQYTILGERVAPIDSGKNPTLLGIIGSRYAAGRQWYLPHPSKAFDFWRDYFSACHDAGITFVKVDNQASISMLSGAEGAAVGIAMWDGMFTAAHQVFGPGRVIHCMAHHERTFVGDIATGASADGQAVVFRATNDFGLPAYTQTQHILYNVLNALVLSATNLVMDSDMFMTKAKSPERHAILRAYSQGPLLLSDHPGQHDGPLIDRLVAHKRSGDTLPVALRSATPLRPLPGRVWEAGKTHPETSIKAYTRFPSLQSAAIVAWSPHEGDAAQTSTVDILHKADIMDALKVSAATAQTEYIVWSTCSSHAVRVTLTQEQVSGRRRDCYNWAEAPLLAFELPAETFDQFLIVPSFAMGSRGVHVAFLGALDKYACLAVATGMEVSASAFTVDVEYEGSVYFLSTEADISLSVDGQVGKLAQVTEIGQGLWLLEVSLRRDAELGQTSAAPTHWTVAVAA